ncbi:TetR family transcriptional regulator [Gordonia sp. CPCC 205515]|uniref:TetR family transcriptional regulator n=1 Tax=Gordonia sp. CPCC 205515 TaxID=3140791 RepID=UPI003AF3A37D
MTEPSGAGPAVRQARVRSGLTLRGLASAIGVSVGTMSAIENGKVALTIDRLQQIARALDIPPAHLLAPVAEPPEAVESPNGTSDWRHFTELDLDPALRAAVEVFTEMGYHGATMRLVATAADSSVAGIYHYHRSKQHLLVTLMDLTLQDIEWRVAAADSEGGDAADRFARMVEALALCHAVRRDLAFISATEMRSLEDPDRERIVAVRRRLQDRLDAAAVEATADGAFATPNPRETARVVATMCMALPYWFSAAGPMSPPDVARQYADHALAMMLVQQN